MSPTKITRFSTIFNYENKNIKRKISKNKENEKKIRNTCLYFKSNNNISDEYLMKF